ncbi:hypothetical protein TNCV_1629291 [Trichonephila clavipes]|uniref:Uncharacterized protein n=1 Tax=Trichonephila clavipes TaxID=2585209 RepID=A0A8X6WA59_TRICX|nr:hypothetical protein TNCV_1629291 [Trichonephila clavipes]
MTNQTRRVAELMRGRVKETCTYANFLLLLELLQGIVATEHQNMWLLPDGILTYFSIAGRNHLHPTYPRKYTGRGELVAWPSRPEPQYHGFLLLEALVYETLVPKVEDLSARIVSASTDIASSPDLFENASTNS